MRSNTFKKVIARGKKFAIVATRYHNTVMNGLLAGALRGLRECCVRETDVVVVRVPGSFEIPLVAQRLLKTKKYAAVICLGAIIKGETRHDEFIAETVTNALMQLGLDFSTPVMLGVITALKEAQAIARSRNDNENRGYQAALSAVEMVYSNDFSHSVSTFTVKST
ncbi:MAG: 6,7-dimethyl-8-ribityllumazine synthase [Candidatus Magasanikbacteria bacterium]|nr:6,7-dimethyl-8-ribityllumazine synthase [Candidatus Magasanikbacteria bacterium]